MEETTKTVKISNAKRIKWLKHAISVNWKVATRALFHIYAEQTQEEKNTRSTIKHNGVGFNGHDANTMTGFVKHWQEKGYFSNNQKDLLMKVMPKYAEQLLNSGKLDLARVDGYVTRREQELTAKQKNETVTSATLDTLF